MQLKALGCPGTLNGAFGGNSSVAWSCTASFISLCDLSRVPSVSPLKSKPERALSLQGWTRHTMKLTATTTPLIFMPLISSRSSFTYSILALVGFSD